MVTLQNSVDKFTWRISETDGCFQLGEPADGDDLYIFNITIISAHNLQFVSINFLLVLQCSCIA